MRASDSAVPERMFAYSSTSSASSTPRVPRLTAYISSLPDLLQPAGELVEARPRCVSVECQARSSRVGRSSRGPTASSQRKPETKLPPG